MPTASADKHVVATTTLSITGLSGLLLGTVVICVEVLSLSFVDVEISFGCARFVV